jgi:competence protein ComGC
MNKKAFTHLEMITAIVLFIFAVFSVVTLYNYFSSAKEVDSSMLDIFQANLLEQAGNFTKVDVFVPSFSDDCFNISLNSDIGDLQENTSVYNNNQRTNFSINNNISIHNEGAGIYEIYSFSFNASNLNDRLPSGECVNVDYNYSLPLKGKIFSHEKLQKIKEDYYNDYDGLKQDLKFQGDFSLVIENETTTLFNMTRQKPLRADVFAKNFPIKIFNLDGKIINAMVNLQVW